MEFNLSNWLEEINEKLKSTFGDRLLLTGVQGSYRRGDASKDSGGFGCNS